MDRSDCQSHNYHYDHFLVDNIRSGIDPKSDSHDQILRLRRSNYNRCVYSGICCKIFRRSKSMFVDEAINEHLRSDRDSSFLLPSDFFKRQDHSSISPPASNHTIQNIQPTNDYSTSRVFCKMRESHSRDIFLNGNMLHCFWGSILGI